MAYRASFTRRALRDPSNLYDFINATESPAAASWFNRLEESILQLQQVPRLGVLTREDASVRQLTYGNKPHVYRVLYQIDEEQQLVIIRQIRHSKRQAFRVENL